jgi:two-component system, LytTR family, response regulator
MNRLATLAVGTPSGSVELDEIDELDELPALASPEGFSRDGRTVEGFRALIVDRDPDSRADHYQLCRALGLQPVGAADSGGAALQLAQRVNPDLLLVDIDLPDMSGLEVLQRLSEEAIAAVVLTARTDCALRAYEAGALDYVTKPVSGLRLLQALSRAKVWLAGTSRRSQSRRTRAPCVPPGAMTPASQSQLLVGERHHRLYVLDPAHIDYAEANGNYVVFHAATGDYVSRDTLKQLETTLEGAGFLRIEHSLLINVGAIDYAVPVGRGRYVFTLSCGTSLRSSRTYRARILQRLPLSRCRGRDIE